MKKRYFSILIPIIFILALILSVSPVFALPEEPQAVHNTPTPDEMGRYLYVVQEGDSCLSIALRFLNGDTNKLRELNELDEACAIQLGQELVLGIYETPVPTAGPSPTPTTPPPTPTPFTGSGEICVYLFNDVNGNGMSEDNEPPIADGAISVSNSEGTVSLTGITQGSYEPFCFENIPEGAYNISVGPPEGYNPTTIMNYPLELMAGDQSIINFGAQISSVALIPDDPGSSVSSDPSATTPPTVKKRSPLMGILGGLLILSGIGLFLYFRFLKR